MPFLGELSALTTAFLWTGTALVFSSAIARVGSTQVNITRLLFALMLLSGSIVVLGLDIRLTAMQILLLALSGCVGLIFGDGFLFKAFQEIGPRISMLIMSLSPALASFFAFIFLGEVMSGWSLAGMAVTIAGIAIVVLERREGDAERRVNVAGVFYGFCGALGQAGGLILAKEAFLIAPVHAFVATFVRIGASVVLLVPAAYLTGHYGNPFKAYRREPRALALTATGAIIGPWLGITFSLIAIANAQVGVAATIMAMPPILMLPLLIIVFKQRHGWTAWIGALLAVCGVGLLFIA